MTFARKYLRPLLLLASWSLLLIGCQDDGPRVEEVVVTEVVRIEGQPVEVTRVVTRVVELPVTVIAQDATDTEATPVTLDVSYPTRLTQLDPVRVLDPHEHDLVQNLFVSLTSLNPATGAVEPQLAESWQVSGDGRTWIFTLRPNIYWVQNDEDDETQLKVLRPVDAHDMVFTVRRLCDPTTNVPDVFIFYIIAGCEAIHSSGRPTTSDLQSIGVNAIDDFTLEFQLTKPADYLLTLLTLPALKPLPAEHLESLGEGWDEENLAVTSGPFILSATSLSGARTVLERNPAWPLPFTGNIDQVRILYLNKSEDSFDLWREQQLDLSPMPLAEVAALTAVNPEKVTLVLNQRVFYLGYNFDSSIFREPELRRAFAAAIDRQRLIDEIYAGTGIGMRHLTPPGTFGAPAVDEVGTGYDPEYARQQMAASSYPSCRLLPDMTYLTGPSDRQLQQAQLIRQMWVEELDCNEEQIRITQVQFGELLANTREGANPAVRPDIWELGWRPYFPDAHNWLHDLLHCSESENRNKRPCSAVDSQLQQAAGITDHEERVALYRQLERDLFADGGLMPIVPLFSRADYLARQSWLQYPPAYFGGEHYDFYVIDQTVKDISRSR
ncbi:MAG: hypothetical protein KDE09_10090 [Anaerolineales bacterium]|nr:hypothetical protein [Anaerolineales bacterium]MCB0018126.1 hypothetical protein [Anaerolineales bacterium]